MTYAAGHVAAYDSEFDEARTVAMCRRGLGGVAVRRTRTSGGPAVSPEQLAQAPLVGRDAELLCLEELLDSGASSGRALLLTGSPGVGKSMLLNAAEHLATARGMRVTRATGSQFEADLSYAGLHQILAP